MRTSQSYAIQINQLKNLKAISEKEITAVKLGLIQNKVSNDMPMNQNLILRNVCFEQGFYGEQVS